jgi:hypothetical protein
MMGALSGLKVLDLSRVLAGPWASMQLADLGAEVIKVENPGGDYVRKMAFPIIDGVSLLHWHLNRGKRSVVIDLRKPEGGAPQHAPLVEARALASELLDGPKHGCQPDDRLLVGVTEKTRGNVATHHGTRLFAQRGQTSQRGFHLGVRHHTARARAIVLAR